METNVLMNFLVWLTTAGGASIAISKIAELIPAFGNLPSNTKKIIMFISSALLGCAALAIMTFVPQTILDAIAPYFAILAAAAVPIFTNQAYHAIVRSVAIVAATESMLVRRETVDAVADIGGTIARKKYTPEEILAMPMPPKPTHAGGPGWLQYEQMKTMKQMAVQFIEIMKANPGVQLFISFPVNRIFDHA